MTFVPGQTLAQIPITVAADTEAGPNLTFQVKLSKPVGATLGLAKAVVTLVDLAGPMSVYVNNPVVQPAADGSTLNFVVSLSSPVTDGHNVVVPYLTVNGSAVAGVDYTAISGTLMFAAGESAITLPVPILDTSVPAARTFSLKLGKATGATLATTKATATIAPG